MRGDGKGSSRSRRRSSLSSEETFPADEMDYEPPSTPNHHLLPQRNRPETAQRELDEQVALDLRM